MLSISLNFCCWVKGDVRLEGADSEEAGAHVELVLVLAVGIISTFSLTNHWLKCVNVD